MGKTRLARDTVRDATRDEVDSIRRENERLKQLVADLSPGAHPQNNRSARSGIGRGRRMSALEKAMMLALIAKSPNEQESGLGRDRNSQKDIL